MQVYKLRFGEKLVAFRHNAFEDNDGRMRNFEVPMIEHSVFKCWLLSTQGASI